MIEGQNASYRFVSEWVLAAPIDQVFDTLAHPADARVEGVMESVLTEVGQEDGLGRRASYRIRSPLIYSLRFDAEVVEVSRPTRLQSIVDGDLVGVGTYDLVRECENTRVTFVWQVSTNRKWMNYLAPIARPLFSWAHNKVMSELIQAMAEHLDARLISSSTEIVD